MIAISQSVQDGVAFSVDQERVIIHSNTLGSLYDFQFKRNYLQQLGGLEDISDGTSALVEHLGMRENIDRKDTHNNGTLMAQQAKVFIGLLSSMLNEESGAIALATPAIHALRQCIKGGWIPSDIDFSDVSYYISLS